MNFSPTISPAAGPVPAPQPLGYVPAKLTSALVVDRTPDRLTLTLPPEGLRATLSRYGPFAGVTFGIGMALIGIHDRARADLFQKLMVLAFFVVVSGVPIICGILYLVGRMTVTIEITAHRFRLTSRPLFRQHADWPLDDVIDIRHSRWRPIRIVRRDGRSARIFDGSLADQCELVAVLRETLRLRMDRRTVP